MEPIGTGCLVARTRKTQRVQLSDSLRNLANKRLLRVGVALASAKSAKNGDDCVPRHSTLVHLHPLVQGIRIIGNKTDGGSGRGHQKVSTNRDDALQDTIGMTDSQ
jgi:hypothetical protein